MHDDVLSSRDSEDAANGVFSAPLAAVEVFTQRLPSSA